MQLSEQAFQTPFSLLLPTHLLATLSNPAKLYFTFASSIIIGKHYCLIKSFLKVKHSGALGYSQGGGDRAPFKEIKTRSYSWVLRKERQEGNMKTCSVYFSTLASLKWVNFNSHNFPVSLLKSTILKLPRLRNIDLCDKNVFLGALHWIDKLIL